MTTAGQTFANKLRKINGVGPRTRMTRDGMNVRARMLDCIEDEFMYPGYYQGEIQQIVQTGFPILHAWRKHVEGYRLPGEYIYRLSLLSPYQFATMLGEMIDAGISNNGQAEIWFHDQAYATV